MCGTEQMRFRCAGIMSASPASSDPLIINQSRIWEGLPGLSAPAGTESASISRCFSAHQRKLSCACSTWMGRGNSNASNFPNTPMMHGARIMLAETHREFRVGAGGGATKAARISPVKPYLSIRDDRLDAIICGFIDRCHIAGMARTHDLKAKNHAERPARIGPRQRQ